VADVGLRLRNILHHTETILHFTWWIFQGHCSETGNLYFIWPRRLRASGRLKHPFRGAKW